MFGRMLWPVVLPLLGSVLACVSSGAPPSRQSAPPQAVSSMPPATTAAPQSQADQPRPLTPIAFGESFVIDGFSSVFFVAIERGYYAEGGLNVTVSRGYGSSDAVKRIASRTSDIVNGDVGTAMLLRSNEDARVKVVAPLHSASPSALLFYEDQNIRSPRDLEGKTIADAPGSAPRVLFPAFAALTGIDTSRIEWRSVDPAVRNTLMGNGQLEIITAFISNLAAIERQAYATNPERRIGVMMYRDYGFDVYGNGLVVADRLIQERPDVVAAFVRGTAKGLRDTYQDPVSAVRIAKRYSPELDIDVSIRQLELLKDVVFTDDIMANGIGVFQVDRLQRTYETMAQYFGMRRDVPLNEMYTTQFAPDPPIKP